MVEHIEDRVSKQLQQGDLTKAVATILSTFGPELRSYLHGTLGDPEEGEDVYQELSIAIWERLPAFRFESTIRTWCYTIAHNRVIKRLQRYSRRNRMRLDTGRQDALPAHSLTSLIEHQQRVEAAQRAAAQLAPKERAILILRSERALSFAEIAQVLGLSSEQSARKSFQRAKERLKLLLEAPAGGGEAH